METQKTVTTETVMLPESLSDKLKMLLLTSEQAKLIMQVFLESTGVEGNFDVELEVKLRRVEIEQVESPEEAVVEEAEEATT